MTVPQDVLISAGIGLAAPFAVSAGAVFDARARRIATTGFLVGWVPLTVVLLSQWPEWSFWYLDAADGNPPFALAVGIALEVGAFFAALKLGGSLDPPRRARALAIVGALYVVALLPWPMYGRVGTAAEYAAGTAPFVWEVVPLLITIGAGGAWFVGCLGAAVVAIRRSPPSR
jgi:hypothetical protein